MQFSVVSMLAIVGAAMAQTTITDYSTEVITITSCAPTVTSCPARTSTVTHTKTKVTGNGMYATGTGAYWTATLTGYTGPKYTGAASNVKVGGALAGVGAVAALLL